MRNGEERENTKGKTEQLVYTYRKMNSGLVKFKENLLSTDESQINISTSFSGVNEIRFYSGRMEIGSNIHPV